jgi:hypothetical protein
MVWDSAVLSQKVLFDQTLSVKHVRLDVYLHHLHVNQIVESMRIVRPKNAVMTDVR